MKYHKCTFSTLFLQVISYVYSFPLTRKMYYDIYDLSIYIYDLKVVKDCVFGTIHFW